MKGNLTGTKPVSRLAIVGAEKQVAEEESRSEWRKDRIGTDNVHAYECTCNERSGVRICDFWI